MGMESPVGWMERSSGCSWGRDGGDWVGAHLGILKALLAAQTNFSVPLQTSPLAAMGLLERRVSSVLVAGDRGTPRMDRGTPQMDRQGCSGASPG